MDSLKSAVGMDVDTPPPAPPGKDEAVAGKVGAGTAAAAASTKSSEGMLDGVTRSVKKMFGAGDDAAVPSPSAKAIPSTSSGTKKTRDNDAVPRPRPAATEEQVGRPRPRANEEQVPRPGATEAAAAPVPRAKATTPKAPTPPPGDSITDSVTSGVKKVIGVDDDTAPVAAPR
jgi:hypothetical protein